MTSAKNLFAEHCKVEGLPLLEPGLALTEGEERLEQALLFRLGFEHLPASHAQCIEGEVGVGEGDLKQRATQGKWRAQLVRGVRDELTLRFEGRLESAEQFVEGVTELLELVIGTLEGEALVQVRSRDRACGCGDGVQPPQDATGDHPAQTDRGDCHDTQGGERPEKEEVENPLLAGGDGLKRVDPGLRDRPNREDGDMCRVRRATHENVGDAEQHGARDKKQRSVQQREAQSHAASPDPAPEHC